MIINLKFQIKYYKKGSFKQTMEVVEFTNLLALKRWYKKEYENGNVEYSFFIGWDYKNQIQINHKIRLKFN